MTCWPIEDFQPTSHIAMDQYLLIPFLVGYSHPFYPSYFDVNRRGTIGFDTLPYLYRWMCFEILRIGSMIKLFVFHAYWAAHVKIVIWHCFFSQSDPNFICVLPIFLGYGFAVLSKILLVRSDSYFHAFAWWGPVWILSTNSTSTDDFPVIFPLKPSFLRDCPASYVWFPRL